MTLKTTAQESVLAMGLINSLMFSGINWFGSLPPFKTYSIISVSIYKKNIKIKITFKTLM